MKTLHNSLINKSTTAIILALSLISNTFAENLGTSSGNSSGSFTAGSAVDGQLTNTDTSVDSQINRDIGVNSEIGNGPSGSLESDTSKGSDLDRTPGSSATDVGNSYIDAGEMTSGPSGADSNMDLENEVKSLYPDINDQSLTDPIAPISH